MNVVRTRKVERTLWCKKYKIDLKKKNVARYVRNKHLQFVDSVCTIQFSLVLKTICLMYMEILILRAIQNALCADAIKILKVKTYGT